MLRISVDFNTMSADPRERVYINLYVHTNLIGILANGMQVILYEENDIQVDAVVEYDEVYDKWHGIPDWDTIIYLNED